MSDAGAGREGWGPGAGAGAGLPSTSGMRGDTPTPGSSPLSVALVTDCYLPNMGGIEVQTHDLACNLQAAGHRVVVITATPGPDELDGVRVHRLSLPAGGVHLPGAHFPVALSAAGFGQLARLLDDEGVDVAHFHGGVGSPLAFIGAKHAQADGVPSVVTTHCMWSWATPGFRLLDQRERWTRWPVVFSAVSEVAAEPVRRVAGPEVDVVVLPNGIDRSAWVVEPAERDPDVFTVVAVMRLAWRKRPLQLVRILEGVRHRIGPRRRLRAVVVGDGPQAGVMARAVRARGLGGEVLLAGRRSREEIRSLYAIADAFVAPANLESFGIAALEARCAGVPVVAKAATGVRGFVEHGREGLLATSDADLADQLARLAADEALRAQMAKHNVDTSPDLDWSAVVPRNGAAYRRAVEVMADRGPGERRGARWPGRSG